MLKLRLTKQQGQSLIEVVVAIGVVVVLVTGLIVGTTSALKTSQYGRTQSLAIKYAQEGIELTRQLRNNGWTTFAGRSGLWCLDKTGAWTPGSGTCPVNIDNFFTRSTTFTWNVGNSRMEVVVNVNWSDGGGLHNTQLKTYFTQWK